MNGNTPDSVQVSPGSNGNEVSLFFDLPFGVDSVGSDFNVTFACDPDCFDIPDCIVEFVTSCPELPVTGVVEDLSVSVNSTILLSEAECGPQSCENFPLTYFCEASTNEICPDTIIGYFISDMDFHRENLGLADNNNDREVDASGNVDSEPHPPRPGTHRRHAAHHRQRHFASGYTGRITCPTLW